MKRSDTSDLVLESHVVVVVALPPELWSRIITEALESEYHTELRTECQLTLGGHCNRWCQGADAANYRLVCLEWHQKVWHCMRQLGAVRWDLITMHMRLYQGEEDRRSLVARFHAVQCLDFTPRPWKITECDALTDVLHQLPHLVALRCGLDAMYHHDAKRPDFSLLTHLRSLSLHRNTLLGDNDIAPLAPYLHELELSECTGISDIGLAQFTALRSLSLLNNYWNSMRLLRPLTALTQLDLRPGVANRKRVEQPRLLREITHLTNLTDLTLDPRIAGLPMEQTTDEMRKVSPIIHVTHLFHTRPYKFPRQSLIVPMYSV